MRQDFSNITPSELALLFPILLEQHNPQWKAYYAQEAVFLRGVFGDAVERISHIGSSAVPGLLAKPTVDILLEVRPRTDLAEITEVMLDEGYVVNEPQGDLIAYMKGYTPRGFKGQAMHIHVREAADWGELYFRDYLIDHPETAQEYAALKTRLKERYTFNRDGYTAAKGEFVEKYTALARLEYPGRYTPEEWLDILDAAGKPTGLITRRGATLQAGQYYMGVHVFIHNRAGQYLLQRRAFNKRVLPGQWNIHMGHMRAGESPRACAVREVNEEIGLALQEDALHLAGSFLWEEEQYFVEIYFARVEYDLSALELQTDEVAGVKAVSAQEMLAFVERMEYRPQPYREIAMAEIQRRMAGDGEA